MINDKAMVAAMVQKLLEQGTAQHESVLVGRRENGNYVGAWFVKVSDRTNVANTMMDMVEWNENVDKFDFTYVNAKREQFNLPPIDEGNLQDPDRAPQPPFTNSDIQRIWEAQEFPGENEAIQRTK